MRSFHLTLRRTLFAGLGLAAFLAVAGLSTTSEAGEPYGFRLSYARGFGGHHGHFHGGGHRGHHHYRRSGPIYHGPSLHYDKVWHHEYDHWTPGIGWHSHGHFDHVPHYVPGHFDHHHGDHIDLNPWYHH